MDIQELQHLSRWNEKVSTFPDQRNVQCHYPLFIEENGKVVITAHMHMCSSISLAYASYSISSNCISVQRRIALPNTTYTISKYKTLCTAFVSVVTTHRALVCFAFTESRPDEDNWSLVETETETFCVCVCFDKLSVILLLLKSSSSSSIGTTAHCGLWPVEQYPSIFSYLPPTLSIFSLPALEDLFLLPLSNFFWVLTFFSSLLVLEWRSFWASYPPPFSLGDLTSLSFALLSILL